MSLVAIAPGNAPVFAATPTPEGTVPGPGLIPSWTTSDTTNAPVTPSADGLSATVNLPESAVVGANFTLTVSLTNADGTVASGSGIFTIVAAPTHDVTGFTVDQIA